MPMKGERKIFIFASNSGLVAFFAVHEARAPQGFEGQGGFRLYRRFLHGSAMKPADVGIECFAARRRNGEST